MFEWLCREPGGPRPADPLTPMEAYAQEFIRASNRSRQLGITLPPVQFLVRKDCLDMQRLGPMLQEYVGRFSQDEIVGQAFVINAQLMALLADKLGLPLTLTMGWFDHAGRQPYRHDDAFIEKLVKEGAGRFLTEGLPLHVWLSSPACEVLDVTLPTTLATVTGAKSLSGRVVYLSNQTPASVITYHPTVVGEDFLVKIGAVI